MSTIRLKTSIPGPQSQLLLERRAQAVPRGISCLAPIFVSNAEGAIVEDVDGNCFIDLAGGIGCLNAGHCHPSVVKALHRQADRYLHTCFMVTPYEPYVRLAEKLNAIAPGPGPKKTAFFSSGAEAVENSVKIARAYTGRPAVICFEHAFHGRTLLSLALTSKTHPYKAGFAPFPAETYRIPYASCYRCAYSLSYPQCQAHCAHALEGAFERMVAAESVAAVIVEPVLGEGGFYVPPVDFFTVLQQICRRHGILLIADEIQTGLARTGYLFASEYFGLEPDMVLSAKTLGGGLPLSAVTGSARIMDHCSPGSLGGTFGGNPVACETALATLEVIERQQLPHRAQMLGQRFRRRALAWQKQCAFIGDVRGIGAMQAIEFVRDRESRTAYPEIATQISQYCLRHGVIVLSAGTFSNIIRMLMPLVITEDQFEEALEIMEDGLITVDASVRSARESLAE